MLDISDLRPKQRQAIEFIEEGFESLILADVGTGKTVITLTALFNMLGRGDITRALVLAPKRVATDVWVQETFEWDHLLNLRKRMYVVSGIDAARRIYVIDNKTLRIVVMNYELLPWLMTNYPEPPFDCLVCDEIDKLKDRTSFRFAGKKKKGKWVFRGMKDYSKKFETVIGLTGTPASNSLLDLWAQCFIVDGGKCLGRSFNRFQRKHFYPTDYNNSKWEVLPTHEEKIYDAIAPIVFRIERDEHIPPVVELPPRWVYLPDKVYKMYKKFERELLVYLEETGDSVESPHQAAGYGRLCEMTAGFSYVRPESLLEKVEKSRVSKDHVWHHFEKYEELKNLISELQGQQLMIVYRFREQLYELQRRFPKLKYLGGGLSDKKSAETIAEWNSGNLQLLAVQPASAGHGLNMQKSHAHHICMLTLPDSAGLCEQVIGRLRRTGSQAKSIFVHKILAKRTVDEERLAVVEGKIYNQQQLLDAMKVRHKDDYL